MNNYTVVVALLLIIAGFGFYWFQWRPSQIGELCSTKATEQARIDDAGLGLETDKTYTLEQLGQKIKEKYPAYNDLSYVNLANKFLQKYTEYNVFIRPSFDNAIYNDCLKENGLSQ